jgi:sulfate permease, SulP family
VLRLKRTRNPDMVSLERFDHFLHDMQARGVRVLLCGVRPASSRPWRTWLSRLAAQPNCVFPEEPEKFSATLKAVRHVYELLEDQLLLVDPAGHCLGLPSAG